MHIILPVIILGIIGIIAGFGLALCSVLMAVKTDERVEAIRAELPGANCGACGYAGCDQYAEALVNGEAKPGVCAPGGKGVNDKIGEILGVEVEMARPVAATVVCNGSNEHVKEKMNYQGIATCKAANMLYGGPLACSYGCIGLGDCARVCVYGAIEIKNGRAYIDRSKCTACTACAIACPKGIIKMLPTDEVAVVVCSNCDKGAATRKVCDVGCIGCMKCVKVCPHDAVKVENNLARIDPDKCTACGECVRNCPVKCIDIIK